MICNSCGTQNADESKFCSKCGSRLIAGYQNSQIQVSMSNTDRTLRLIAFILSLITTICVGILLIPLAWMVPMTVMSYRVYKGRRPNTVALGVCTLIFLNLVSGILLLCSKKDND